MRYLLRCDQGAGAVEIHIGQAQGQFLARPAKLHVGQNDHPGFVQQFFAQSCSITDTTRRQSSAQRAEIREQVEAADRFGNDCPHPFQLFPDIPTEVAQNAA